jgi:hypothetical protein
MMRCHREVRVQFYLKTDRSQPADEVDEATGRQTVKRLRHQGRKVVEIFVLNANGAIDRYQERTRRKLGSNAIASRTWLCETTEGAGGEWGNGHYIPDPMEDIDNDDPTPPAVVVVLTGAEGADESVVEQLQGLPAR